MELRNWLNSVEQAERERVAEACKTTVAYLWQLAGGHRQASWELAVAIQDATDSSVTKSDLRPDIWPSEVA